MLVNGEKLHIITRRLFETDLRRHFVGEILDVSGAVIWVRGYAFVFDEFTKQFERHEELRTNIFPFIDAGLVITLLPKESLLEEIRYIFESNQRFITDGKTFKFNVTEFGMSR